MSKIIYVHVGLPKTGSSAIQSSLMTSEDILAGMDIRYVQAGTQDFHDNGHHILLMSLLGERGRQIYAAITPERIAQAWDDALREIQERPEKHFFISSELFSMEMYMPAELERLRDAFADYEVRIIMMLRDPGDFLNSVYAQRVRDGYLGTVEEYAEIIWPLLNWKDTVQRWRTVFGLANVLVMRFENLDRTQLADDMLRRVLGLDYKEQRLPNVQTNGSVPHAAIEFFQHVNKSTLRPGQQAELRNYVHRYLTAQPTGLPRPDFVSDDLRAKLQTYCEWPNPV